MIPVNFKPLTPEYMKIMDHACIEVIIRPHKVDLQIIVTRPHAILKNPFIIHNLSKVHKI